MKTPLPGGGERYSAESQRRHTLFCGTQAIQAKGNFPGGRGALAVVVRTGKPLLEVALRTIKNLIFCTGMLSAFVFTECKFQFLILYVNVWECTYSINRQVETPPVKKLP